MNVNAKYKNSVFSLLFNNPEKHSTEVFNMLLTEWNTEEAKLVWLEEGREEGREERDIEIIRNALAKGFPIETVQELTGIDIKFIQNIQAEHI